VVETTGAVKGWLRGLGFSVARGCVCRFGRLSVLRLLKCSVVAGGGLA
jgi:hypothetical protein